MHGPAAVKRLRGDLERAYELLEHGLGEFERSSRAVAAASSTT